MKDIFERIKESTGGPLGQYQKYADGYFYFPKLEGELGPEMVFNGKKVLNWSLNNYLGLANNPEVRAADEEGARRGGLAYPMGARMMSGHTSLHEEVEAMLCEYTHKKAGFLLNFGYQGQISILDTIVSLRDVIVYDSEAHACLIDGFRVTGAKRFKYQHNDIESLRKQLTQATALAEKQGGGILVATEGVYGMEGDLGALDKIVALKKEFNFRILIDGFRVTGAKRFKYQHNDIESLRKQLTQATALAEKQGGGILVATEGVYGMEGDLGALGEICALKKEFDFRILIDDAHGMGVMGPEGRGTHTHFHCEDDIDLYFCAFAKTMAIIGGFIGCNDPDIITYLRFNMRSQIYAKSLPLPLVVGNMKRLELIKTHPEYREHLWEVVNALQSGLKEEGFDIGRTESPVTPVFFQGDVNEATNVVVDLRENYGIFCSMVVYPVVPKGQIMLRIIPTASHTLDHVARTISVFKEVKAKLDAGLYKGEMKDMNLFK